VNSANIIERLFHTFCTWIDRWPPERLGFFLQASLLFAFPLLLCSALFRQGSRSILVQVLAAACGLICAMAIPAERLLPHAAFLKACLFLVCFIFLCFLPGAVPKLVTPTLGIQRRLSIALYVLLLFLFLANLLIKE
jgi:hypothetical protein